MKTDNAPQRKAFERDSVLQWDFELPDYVDYLHQGMTVRAYPMIAFNKEDDANLSLKLHESSDIARFYSQLALTKLALVDQKTNALLKKSTAYLTKEIFKPKSRQDPLALLMLSLTPKKSQLLELKQTLIEQALYQSCFQGKSIRNATSFYHAIEANRSTWVEVATEFESAIIFIVKTLTPLQRAIQEAVVLDEQTDQNLEDIKRAIYSLFTEHFLLFTTAHQLKQIPRYLQVADTVSYTHLTLPTIYSV